MDVRRDGDVFVLDLGSGHNRIDPEWIVGLNAVLDQVEASDPPRALVTTCSGDFFGMGFDLEWMAARPEGVRDLVDSMHDVLGRLLVLPASTVAALSGHAVAGGALFSLAHDFRVMPEEGVVWCLPEVDVEIAISPGLIALVKAKLSRHPAFEALATGRRYSGREAASCGIAEAVKGDEVLPRALAIASGLAEKHPETYGAVKERLYSSVVPALTDRDANAADLGKFEPAMRALGISAPASNS